MVSMSTTTRMGTDRETSLVNACNRLWEASLVAIGFAPRVSFDEGMRQTGAWLRGEAGA